MRYYNAIAEGYEVLHGGEQLRKLALIQRYIPKNALILDVGCGTGLSKMLGNVIGIDPSRKLLAQANFSVVEGVAEALPFKDNSFDAVVSVTALHHCTGIRTAIMEIKRVAKAAIILSILKKAKNYGALEKEIKKQLPIGKTIEDPIDAIFVCAKVHPNKAL